MQQTFADVTMVGRLGQEPKLIGRDKNTCELSVAVNFPEKTADGSFEDRVQFHRVVVFKADLVEFASEKLHKGDLVKLNGTLRPNPYKCPDGAQVVRTDIHLDSVDGSLRLMGRRSARKSVREPAEA